MSIILVILAIVLVLATRRVLAIKREQREIAQVAKLMRDYDFSQRRIEQDTIYGMRR